MAVVRTCAQHASSLSLSLLLSLPFSSLLAHFPLLSLLFFFFFPYLYHRSHSLLTLYHAHFLSFSLLRLPSQPHLPSSSQFLLALLFPCHYLFPFTFLSLSLSLLVPTVFYTTNPPFIRHPPTHLRVPITRMHEQVCVCTHI